MEYLFTVTVVLIMANGRYEIYADGEDRYFCKMVGWSQYQNNGPGDLTLRKNGKKWESSLNSYPHLPEALVTEIKAHLAQIKRQQP